MRLPPLRVERWYERPEFTTELQAASSARESVLIGAAEAFARLEAFPATA